MITVASAPEARFLSHLRRVLARPVFYEHLFLSCQMKQNPTEQMGHFPFLARSPSASSSFSCCPVRRKYFLRMTKMMANGMAAMKMYGRMMDTVKMAPVTIRVS